MALSYTKYWIDIVEFLTEKLGMTRVIKTHTHETYRIEKRDHIVTVQIKIDECAEGPYLTTKLTIDGVNLWWHDYKYHSGYTLEDDLKHFDEVIFVRTISFNSRWFSELWKPYADL